MLFKRLFNKNKDLKNYKIRLYGKPQIGRWWFIEPKN